MLEAKNISFTYKKSRPVFCDLSFQVSPGERVCLVAPSGYGKTTLCKLLSGYEAPQQGSVLVDGDPLPQKGVCPVQLIGQHPEKSLDPRMRLGDSLAEAKGVDAELVAALGIKSEWLSRFPHELSGGEMQRFCIARALVPETRYLIADEITTMLDAVTQAKIWKVLIEVASQREVGMVLTTHSLALADRISTRKVDLVQQDESGPRN